MSLLQSISSSWCPLLLVCYILCHLCNVLCFAFKMDPVKRFTTRIWKSHITNKNKIMIRKTNWDLLATLELVHYWNEMKWNEIAFPVLLLTSENKQLEKARKKNWYSEICKPFAEFQNVSWKPSFPPVNLSAVLNAPEIPAKRQVWAFWETAIEPLRYLRKIKLELQFPFKLFPLTLWHTGNMHQ